MSHPPYFANAAVMMIDVDQVDPDLGGRIGLFFPAKAEALAALIGAHGQNDPIKVMKRGNAAKTAWKLVAGLHRLEACRTLKIQVAAIEVLGDANFLNAIQASENMDRRELAPLERAMFVNAVAEAAQRRMFATHGVDNDKALAAKAKAAKIQFSDIQKADAFAVSAEDNLSSAYGWSAETAEACGLGPKEIQRSLRVYRCIVDQNRDLMDAFKGHPVAQVASMLLKICPLSATMRRAIIEWLIERPECDSVEDALVEVAGKSTKGADKDLPTRRFNTAIRFFGQIPKSEAMGLFESSLFQDLLPKTVRDLLAPIRVEQSL